MEHCKRLEFYYIRLYYALLADTVKYTDCANAEG